jgi:hypothetical protein
MVGPKPYGQLRYRRNERRRVIPSEGVFVQRRAFFGDARVTISTHVGLLPNWCDRIRLSDRDDPPMLPVQADRGGGCL